MTFNQGHVTSRTVFKGVSVSDICAGESCSSMYMVQFYYLDTAAPLVAWCLFYLLGSGSLGLNSGSVAALQGMTSCPNHCICVLLSKSTEREQNALTRTSVP